MLKFDEKKIIYTTNLRKVLFNLLEETDYSGECEMDIEIPIKKRDFSRKRYFKY